MTKKGFTKDELFMLKLYELSSKRVEGVAILEVGRAIGVNDRGARVIARELAQANFIKKVTDETIRLTEHGLNLVQELMRTNGAD